MRWITPRLPCERASAKRAYVFSAKGHLLTLLLPGCLAPTTPALDLPRALELTVTASSSSLNRRPLPPLNTSLNPTLR